MANTLLVPGYIDEEEVEKIAIFIASINPDIPYSLLVFHPQFLMSDLPISPRKLVYACYDAAKKQGLTRLRIGNKDLLCSFTLSLADAFSKIKRFLSTVSPQAAGNTTLEDSILLRCRPPVYRPTVQSALRPPSDL